MVYKNLLDIMLDPDYGDITDVNEGHDIKVICTKAPGMKWATTDIRPRPKTTPLGTKSQIKEWTDDKSFPSLDDMYSLKSYDELESIINAWLNGDEETTNDFSANTETRGATRNQNSTKTASTSYGDDLDDAFADIEGDMPF